MRVTGTTVVVLVVVGIALLMLLRPSVRNSLKWRATVTPLASIIGSGFLVVAPLMAGIVGSWAPLAMGAIVVFAYMVGAVIRFNIAHSEPTLEGPAVSRSLNDLDRVSDLALGFAYVISVAFYLQLLASFVLEPFGLDSPIYLRLLASSLVVSIAVVGWVRGLDGLELIEEYSVGTKLSIIAGLLAGLIWFNVTDLRGSIEAFGSQAQTGDAWTVARSLAGMLLVVQGFETSRYLGHKYDAPTRIATMKAAQVISAVIYVVFVLLIVPLFDTFPEEVTETAILEAARAATPVLVPLIIVAAIASQFSAAVADSAGGGGMLAAIRHRTRPRVGYLAVALGALAVIWSTDVFGIIVFASRAFGAYYLIQAIIAFAATGKVQTGGALVRTRVGISIVVAGLSFVVVAGIPAG